jgi:hypothetical protein
MGYLTCQVSFGLFSLEISLGYSLFSKKLQKWLESNSFFLFSFVCRHSQRGIEARPGNEGSCKTVDC